MRNAVARIRARLGHDAVETVGWEYRLGLDPDAIDSLRFERLVSTARGHVLRGEPDRAIDAYRRAIALWRGAPLQEVAAWGPGIVEAMRLTEIRTSAEEELLDARLAAGEDRTLIPEAERLVREMPVREDRWAILALANYRAGRQAEALATIRSARRRLGDELGIEPGTRLTELETAILRQDPAIDAAAAALPASTECPYPGLRAFGPDDAEHFFGRDSDIDGVLDLVRPAQVVAVAGPSGSGKSSLVLAGVVPRLRDAGRSVAIVTPAAMSATGIRSAAERASVIVIDQAEELLASPPPSLRDITAAVVELRNAGACVILTVRSDFLDRLRALPDLGDAVRRGIYLVGPLSPAAWREAIEEPARQSHLQWESGLVEVVLRDAGDRGATLPHLSHALRETWARREGSTLTIDGYERSGGIAGAIAQSAETVYATLSEEDRAVCRSIMLRLVERGTDGTTARLRPSAAPLVSDGPRRRVLERLIAARLVVVDGDAVTVAHEAVAAAWPRLDGWLEEDAAGARIMHAVTDATASWESEGRPEDELLRGARLHAALEWREATRPDLTDAESDFLDASADRSDAEQRQLIHRADRDRRQNRRLRWSLGGAAVLLVVALAAGGIAVVQGREAVSASERARIEALVATSLSLQSTDRDVASLLAVEAYRRWPDDGRVRSSLWGAMTSADGLVRKWTFEGARTLAAPIPGTNTVLLVTDTPDRSEMAVMDLTDGALVRAVGVDLPSATLPTWRNVAVSADGSTAVVQTPLLRVPGDQETCCVNDLVFIDLVHDAILPGSQVSALRTTSHLLLSPDGSEVFIGNLVTGDLMRMDTRTGEVTASSPDALSDHVGEEGQTEAITRVDTERIAIGTRAGVTVYDTDSLSPVAHHPTSDDRATWALAHGKGMFVASGPEGIVGLDDSSGSVLWTNPGPAGGACWQLAVDAPREVAYCSQLGSVTTLSLTTGAPAGEAFATYTDDAAVVTLTPDGSGLLLADRRSLHVRRIDGAGPASELIAAGRRLSGGFDADGGIIITAEDDGAGMQLWDVDADRPLGSPGPAIDWASRDRIVRPGELLAPVSGGDAYPIDPEVVARAGALDSVVPALPGPTAFVVGDAGLVPFDPLTGEADGPALVLNGDDGFGLMTVSESADSAVAAVTWWNPVAAQSGTTVFDRRTGEVLAHGAVGSEGSLVTAEEELLIVSDTLLARYDLRTVAPLTSLPKPFGGGTLMELDDARDTLLVVGWDNRAALYDFGEGIRLGDPLETTAVELAGGAHLSADGARLVTGSAEGVLLWELDPSLHAEAACLIAGRELTATEWTTYFGDEPQTPTCAGIL